VHSGLREIDDVLDGLERAKTSVRALEKYVPVDLVRQLFETNQEPQLGGELIDISLMFTDIEGFTGLSERLAPDALARALGQYLEAMTRAVRSTDGTVDKFIGDAVMAFWNAPVRAPDHATRACRAALRCIEATRQLYASPGWEGLPALFTRFGLHAARVMVGHFGSPDRLSYTALGDGVNLAARLEGLCKQYEVGVLASEAVVKATGDAFVFRRLDKVAVKGKKQWVQVYELLGEAGACDAKLPGARAYEAAFDAYLARDFRKALATLEPLVDDAPSRLLAARARVLLEHPPAEDWDGVYVATSK
jgi:adenylate cyclase